MKAVALFLFFFPLKAFSQDLTGTWEGFESGSSYLKIVIEQLGDSCFGYTYDEGGGFCKTNFAGRFDPRKQKLRGHGVSFIARSAGHVLATYNLTYFKEGDDEFLEGGVGMKGVGGAILSMGMPAFASIKKTSRKIDTTTFMLLQSNKLLQREQAETLLPAAPVDKVLPAPGRMEKPMATISAPQGDTLLTAMHNRVSKMVQTIYTSEDTIKLMIYDNGEVDDDTVTVFFDNANILDRYRITEKAKELELHIPKDNAPHTVELFANNLGTIPPNSALIVVLAGNERYEVHASYDLSTNAKIIFQYKP